MTDAREILINVPIMARVEGEGALDLTIRDGRIETLKLQIFEAPRLFEKFLEGRSYDEVPDMVARICGICPVAYQMSAVHAIESIFGMDMDPWTRAMRRVLYCGEWIESHALHIHLLAAPDFLGFPNAIAMAERHADIVRRGLYLQGIGNRLIRMFGARSVHPVGVRIGGFHRAPRRQEVAEVLDELRGALPQAEALVRWTASLPLPDDDQSFTCVALRHPDEYPMNAGRLVSTDGLDIVASEFEQHIVEHQEPHSTALHATLHGRPYLVGPLARLNLNLDRLPTAVRQVIDTLPVRFPSRNMFHSVVARAIEIYYAIHEAVHWLERYAEPQRAWIPATPRAGSGAGCTEAPRGILWHRYALDADGMIRAARIVPPTSQNQARIEQDLRVSLESYGLDRNEQELRLRGETVIRNYDPCISCSTHFLRLSIDRQ